MPSAEHGFEMASRGFPDGTEINMNEHKDRKDESYDNMHKISEMQTACPEDLVDKNYIREDQRPAGDEDQGHKEVKYGKVRYFLERVEFSPAVDRIWGFFTAEDTKNVIAKLHRYFFFQPAPSHAVIKSVSREHVSEEYHKVINSEQNTCDIMQRNCNIKPDHRVFGVGILHAQPGNDQEQVKYCIDQVPQADPNGI